MEPILIAKHKLKRLYPYIIAIFLLFYVSPLIAFLQPRFFELNPSKYILAGTTFHTYFFHVWFIVPLSSGIISTIHIVRQNKFSWVLQIEAIFALFLYVWWIDWKDLLYLSGAIGIFFMIECFGLLHNVKSNATGQFQHLLSQAALNQRLLVLFFFWMFALPTALQICVSYLIQWVDYYSFPGILLPQLLCMPLLACTHKHSLTKCSLLITVFILILSIIVVNLGIFRPWWKINLCIQVVSYLLFLVITLLLDRG